MATVTEEYGVDVTRHTTEYLSGVRECTGLLPAILLRREEAVFDDLVVQLRDRESSCDERLRGIRTLLSEAEPNYTGVYLRAGDLLELYVLVDEVANSAEQFAREFSAVDPPITEATMDDLVEMAVLASRATWLLQEAIEAYVGSLVAPGPDDDVTGDVERVADLESRADDHAYAIIDRCFDRHATTDAILIRDLVHSLDATIDAAEDAAEHLLFLRGADPDVSAASGGSPIRD